MINTIVMGLIIIVPFSLEIFENGVDDYTRRMRRNNFVEPVGLAGL